MKRDIRSNEGEGEKRNGKRLKEEKGKQRVQATDV
jgi:hypothetical protein